MVKPLYLFTEAKQPECIAYIKKVVYVLSVVSAFLCLFLRSENAFSQEREITSREVSTLRYKLQRNIVPQYEDLLNFISSKYTEQNEVLPAINNLLEGNKQLFENEKVIIENDMIPGADTVQELARDMSLKDYLGNFNVSYNKSEDRSVSFSKVMDADVSPLLKSSFFYFKVFFVCTYYNTNSSVQKFYPFKRLAEVKLLWENNAWKLYIMSVRFPTAKDYTDQSNIYTGVIKTNDDIETIMADFNNDEARRENETKRTIAGLMEEGDDEYSKENYDLALLKYREAFGLNLSNVEAKRKLDNTRKAIENKRQKEKADAERKQHIADMKNELTKQYEKYNFENAKQICDSLTNDYGVTSEDVTHMSDELTVINAALDGIETAINTKNKKAAVSNCEQKIKDAKGKKQSYQAELYYQMAYIYYKLDSTERKQIRNNLDLCIGLSAKKHQRALHMRSQLNMAENDVIKAIDDASIMIGNDSRNESNYTFRAELYERNGQKLKAIDDYGKAILYNTKDSSIYLKKAKLEYDTLKYKDAQTTSTIGIDKTSCYGNLYFIRGKANDKLKDFQEAGNDFAKAVYCGIGVTEKQYIWLISENYVTAGKNAYVAGKYIDAQTEFSKAINIDSNVSALYWRARASVQLKKDDKALTDLDLLLRLNKTFQDAHHQRGLLLKRMTMYYEAINDFDLELAKYPNTYQSVLERGNCFMLQQKFQEAAIAFDRAAALAPSDSVWYLASLAYYNTKNYINAIDRSKKARDKGTKKFEVYYICGRAYYDTGDYKEAYKEYEKAREINQTDESVNLNYALALEADEQYLNAAKMYGSLIRSKTLKDTALFRSAMCWIKKRDDKFYNEALTNLTAYLNGNGNADKSLVYAWMGFVALLNSDFNQVNEYIGKSQVVNKEQPMLYYLIACKNAQQDNAAEAVANLEKAIASKSFKKADIENESLLKPIRRNDGFKKLMAKNFP